MMSDPPGMDLPDFTIIGSILTTGRVRPSTWFAYVASWQRYVHAW
jgi:hypothetical protein